tara:strand:+ start:16 stop:582 length:567 start_codon:yes stop_codon:yes gene_type:complete
MKAPLFEFPSYRYEVSDWEFKKKGLLNRINKQNFIRCEMHNQNYEVDRGTSGKNYLHYFRELVYNELNEFCEEAKVTCKMTDCWTVRYQKGDYQHVHNHRGWGFSGLLFVEFDPEVHSPPCFVAPWQEPRTDTTSISPLSGVNEGSLFIFPSFCLHYVNPNQSRKQRVVTSFDLLPETPEHQTINKIV